MSRSIGVGDDLPQRSAPDITMERIVAVMEVMKDTNPVHVDQALVDRMGLRGVVNQGPCNLAYVTNMLAAWTGDPDCVRALRVRFHSVVVPGDELVAGGRVLSLADDGTAECAVWLRHRDGTTMLSGTAVVSMS